MQRIIYTNSIIIFKNCNEDIKRCTKESEDGITVDSNKIFVALSLQCCLKAPITATQSKVTIRVEEKQVIADGSNTVGNYAWVRKR